MPKRIQMTRQHPWRADHPDAVIVARPSKWGNPFRIVSGGMGTVAILDPDGLTFGLYALIADARADCVDVFRDAIHPAALASSLPDYPLIADIERELRGRDLACWCPLDQPCHADVLLELANRPEADA